MDFINLIFQNCDFVSCNYDFVFVTIHLYILQSGLISNLKFGLRSTSLFFFYSETKTLFLKQKEYTCSFASWCGHYCRCLHESCYGCLNIQTNYVNYHPPKYIL